MSSSNNTFVVNIRYDNPFDIYIGRGSVYGNPYTTKRSSFNNTICVASTNEAIRLYQEWLLTDLIIQNWRKPPLEDIYLLKNKILGCYCRPPEGFRKRILCHGQILAALANGIKPEDIP